ncbi:nuclear factor 7, brain-like [Cololabis saira]|uniref:nuclear factor 7, brain-like n=1 Tax=Cololabis saira TaxID=129043 RepID=UPI002AD47ECB|nr:nuclear factor 7, brain-like [Cololabis saira]
MAAAAGVLSKEQLLCAICLDVFSQPVSTPCGHNFCRDCIRRCWQGAGLPQCPVCKHKFYKKPDLKVNTFISEVAAQFKQLGEKREGIGAADQSTIPTTAVSCDVCIGRTVKAFKSCLDCLASFCETHLEPHHVLGTLKDHRLINPMMNMRERVCEKHERLLDQFCVTEQLCVCRQCVKDDHRAHRVVPIQDEGRDRRVQVGSVQTQLQEMIQDRLGKIREINQAVQLSRRNTERELEESAQVFGKLLRIVQRGQEDVAEVIRAKQRQVQSRAGAVLAEMEKEMDQLRRRSVELECLACSDDDLHLLRSFPAASTVPSVPDRSDSCVEPAEHVGTVRRALRRAAGQLEETAAAEVKRLCTVEFQRARVLAVDVTLDADSAHPKLVLSEDLKQVHHGDVAAPVPDTPGRFYPCVSVLGREGFSSGRFYYEVQVGGKTEWDVGVGLESVSRKGGNHLSPERGYWTLGMRAGGAYWALSSPPVCLPLVDAPRAVGVYVDVGWGQVSFYNADSRSHIYTFTGYSFGGRLVPYFNPRRNHGGVNSAPLIISHLEIRPPSDASTNL